MKIEIKGTIVADDEKWIYDWFGITTTTPGQVNNLIEKAENEDLEVFINSPGGSVFAGSEIYTNLKDSAKNVIVKITGIAASAASVVAMAGNKVMMSPTAQIMIHNSASETRGDYRDMAHSSEILQGINASIANAYELKTGLDHSELLELMNKETWLNSKQAKEMKFIDEVMFQNEVVVNVEVGKDGLLPRAVIDKMKNERTNKIENEKSEKIKNSIELAKAKLKFNIL